jgi:hypothetical protein
MTLPTAFTPDYERYDGVRPIQEIGYKLIWLAAVAWPLWSASQLAGAPAEGMTYSFLPVVLPIALMPWRYVLRTYVWSQAGRDQTRKVAFS